MPVLNRIAEFGAEMTEWRRHLHRRPELGFDCHETAAFVAARLRDFGVDEVHEGIAQSGVVALIHGRGDGPVIGLRADMDALPMDEATGADHASETVGKMHACGHDGHTVMLLGAARYLTETRNFAGCVALLFQPAEEAGGGGGVMVDEGVMDRFGIARIFALHNAPGQKMGSFETCAGPIMAAVDEFEVTFEGKGGHAAFPDLCTDPIPPALAFAQGCQSVVARNAPPTEALVVSVTQVHAGSASNVVPGDAWVGGTVRSFAPAVRDMAERRIRALAEAQAQAYGVTVRVTYSREYPPTVNDADQAAFAAEVAREVAGDAGVREDRRPEMGAEDFAYMLQARPGAYLFLGQGPGAFCHHPEYDFNDEIAPVGASFFARLVERAQPL
ncbi:amidohydrolase [Mesobaculum littorinae]|uniref:Amidohydrolase n=1 Tax=Mesobaculum littorinae TaxID=2486419 RepID=A0A438AKX6_9RHOB|nr:M20 aminoacylase family protein [Mesobaculum littorinae]RVV99319.1 amidohydrolase [Mesobaculum littorinae]